MEITLVILVVFIVLITGYIVGVYNRLVTLKQRFENAFAQIEVQLKRRYDLIPNLVEIAKGYMTHERETLEAVINARNEAKASLNSASGSPGGAAIPNLAGAESMLQSALGKLNVVMEDYPNLLANEQMKQLSEEMTSTENRVAFARQGFNDAVMAYNIYRQSFPPILFAGLFGHGVNAILLEFSDSSLLQAAPSVSFNQPG